MAKPAPLEAHTGSQSRVIPRGSSTSPRFPSVRPKGRESTPLQNTAGEQPVNTEKSAQISVLLLPVLLAIPHPAADFPLKMQTTVLCPSEVRFVTARGSSLSICQSLSCLAGDFSMRGPFPVYIQNNRGESGSPRLELQVCGSKQHRLRRTHCNLEMFQCTKAGSSHR